MKKTTAILLVLIIGMVGIFATNNSSTTLELTTTVGQKYGLVVSAAGVDDEDSLAQKVTAFAGLLSAKVPTIAFDDSSTVHSLHVSYMSNIVNQATVTTTAKPMVSDTSSTPIGYYVTVGSAADPLEVKSTDLDPGVTITFLTEGDVSHGLRVKSVPFEVQMNETDWDTAGFANDYTATWTIELSIE